MPVRVAASASRPVRSRAPPGWRRRRAIIPLASSEASSISCVTAKAMRRRAMGKRLRLQRRMHQGLRLRRQSALPRLHGEGGDGPRRERCHDAAPQRRPRLSQCRARRESYLAAAARRRAAGAARAGQEAAGRRAPGLCVLYRLQRAQDAAYRAARARHHGCAGHDLRNNGRAQPLLRRRADAHRRRRDLRTVRREHHRQTRAKQGQAGGVVVPVVPGAVRRHHAADAGEDARREAVRHDAVHDVPARISRPPAANAARAGADARRAAPPSRHRWRRRGGGRHFERSTRNRDRRPASACCRAAKQQFEGVAELPPRTGPRGAQGRRSRQVSMRWSQSTTPITAPCVRTSATGRSASSTFTRSSAPAWGCITTIISSG